MKFNQHLWSLFLGTFFSMQSLLGITNPIGQIAQYKIDKDPKRTSSMLKSGTIQLSIPNQKVDKDLGTLYEIGIEYHFRIALMGNYEGTRKATLEQEYFSEETLQKLRELGHFEGKFFKAHHMGFADAKTMDGKTYPHCDKIMIDDLKDPGSLSVFSDLMTLIASALERNDSEGKKEAPYVDKNDIEDLKILAHVYPSVPVLGATKIDVTGSYKGMNIRAGGDFVSH